jgi:hypothetical protein
VWEEEQNFDLQTVKNIAATNHCDDAIICFDAHALEVSG